ncbi:MAG: Bacterial domain [Anaerosolibacter sp.]|jgi:uncharacterized protein YgiM (DUF1202 family)|uniref:SH3 domain-containing protein n=1 Tax=Anaerosolibacter sp. TaxID=1872527 RepID=UPI0026075BF3|nr:SH3 domain-containing protein [Anaerosolibacter sp.]MDF2547730.1 Bacterial domain [Anaerosolibacter sp.]
MGIGYVKSQYLKSDVNRGSSWPAVVNLQDPNSYLNVRSIPSTSGSIIGTLYHGDTVTVYLDRTIPSDWSKIGF